MFAHVIERFGAIEIPVFRWVAGSTYLLGLQDRHKHMWRMRGVTYKTQGKQKTMVRRMHNVKHGRNKRHKTLSGGETNI